MAQGHCLARSIPAAVCGGIIWVALFTGLVFAKAARPESSVLFSDVAVISQYQGKPTFMFRLANARGNSIVEASLSVTVLISEVSPEGHRINRLYELELVRTRQPLFALSWMVFHVLDEESPFFGSDRNGLPEGFSRLIVTMVGHDETYASTVHERHIYLPGDVRCGEDFVDVLSVKDGRFLLDFRKFHSTVASGELAQDADA